MLGYEVLSAKDGLEALEVYRDQKEGIDLILSDLSMPVMDGLALRKELEDEGDPVPVLLSSGHSLDDLKHLPGWDSSRPFLEKPWDLSVLARSVRELLDEAAAPRSDDAGC
jgi:CheY-like chemotaxis protein